MNAAIVARIVTAVVSGKLVFYLLTDEGKKKFRIQNGLDKGNRRRIGPPGEIRTPDTQVRSLVLYPAELRAEARSLGFSLKKVKAEAKNLHSARENCMSGAPLLAGFKVSRST